MADFKTSFPTSNSVHASSRARGGMFLLLRFFYEREFWKRQDVRVADGDSFQGKDEINQAVYTASLVPSECCPEKTKRRHARHEEDSLSRPLFDSRLALT